MKQSVKTPPLLSTVDKTFSVLELIAESKYGHTLTELVKKLKISMGAAQRITNSLIALQYLYKDPKTKTLHLTPKMFFCGYSSFSRSEIHKIAFPHMSRLNEDLDEIVNLGVLSSDEEVVYIARVDKTSGPKLTTTLQVGSRRPIHANAMGKVILAFLREADQRRIVDYLYSANYKGKTYCSKKAFLVNLPEHSAARVFLLTKANCSPDILALCRTHLESRRPACGGDQYRPSSKDPPDQIKRKFLPHLIKTGKNISKALGNLGKRVSITGGRRSAFKEKAKLSFKR